MSDCNKNDLVGFEAVYRAELEQIGQRREKRFSGSTPELKKFLRDEANHPPDYEMGDLTGLCLSGGGIRSSAFSIGALQALDALTTHKSNTSKPDEENTLFNEFDYMSTVSGGGYTGTAITAAMMDSADFPLKSSLDKDESPELQHIRDHSNYLFPKGGILEKLENLGVLLRGIFAHLPVILSVLMISVCICVWSNPTISDLDKPIFEFSNQGKKATSSDKVDQQKISETETKEKPPAAENNKNNEERLPWTLIVLWSGLAAGFLYLIMGGPLPGMKGDVRRKSSNLGMVMMITGAMFSTGMVAYLIYPTIFYGIFRISMLMMVFLVGLMLLLGWGRSAAPQAWKEVGSRNTAAVGWLLLLVAFVAFANLQPYIIGQIHDSYLAEAEAARGEGSKKKRQRHEKNKSQSAKRVVAQMGLRAP